MTRSQTAAQATTADSIRPFSFEITDAELNDLRLRLEMTRWPEKETVDDLSQGPRLATMQALAKYWAEEYDWRKCEARIKSFPNFVTEIDGLDIHFIHVRSKHDDALPLIVTHGWPGSIVEQLKIIEPLTDPTAHGGTESDAFHLVIGLRAVLGVKTVLLAGSAERENAASDNALTFGRLPKFYVHRTFPCDAPLLPYCLRPRAAG